MTETTFQPLTGATDPRVVAFLKAWHENGRTLYAKSYPNTYAAGSYDSLTGEAKHAQAGRKYINLDRGGSGMFMVEKATGMVYGIKAYGRIHRGKHIGHIEAVTADYLKATAENRCKGCF